MKFLITLMLLNATMLIPVIASSNTSNQTLELFLEQYKRANKVDNKGEQIARISLNEALDFIAKHNKLYESGHLSHRLAANKFIGLKNEELPKIQFKEIVDKTTTSVEFMSTDLSSLPDQFDWRQLGKVTRAKDQLSCNCCYAFTVVATVESAVAIRDNLTLDIFEDNSLDLSEQQIVDCSDGDKYKNNGCDYGFIDDSYLYVIDNGVVSEQDYPYKDQKHSCQEPLSNNKTFIASFKGISVHGADQIKRIIINKGPVIAPINNDGLDFLYYDQGIIRTEVKGSRTSKNFFNHAVVIIGWGQQNGTHYWIIKNSWSENWGENGFARIEFGIRGIDKYIYYPMLTDSGQVDIYNRILIFVFIILAILMFVSVIAVLMFCCDERGKLTGFSKLQA